MAPGDDDRPRKSWRERDAAKDRGSQRRDERPSPAASKQGTSQAYRAYKSQLDKMFSGGGQLPEAMRATLAEADVGTHKQARADGLAALREAVGGAALLTALRAFEAEHGMPEDEEVLARLLELEDGPVVTRAIATLTELHGAGRLKRATSLKARLKTVQMTLDDDDAVAAARALLQKL